MPAPQPVVPKVRSFICPRCGHPVDVRAPRNSQSVVCGACVSILDCSTPEVRLLQEGEKRMIAQPIPLGRRGKLKGELLECMGFMRRSIRVEGEDYAWSEYVLWSPYVGYRWLTEYEGHWNYVKTTNVVANPAAQSRSGVRAYGMNFRHFQSATAEVTYVLGEFPWIVRRGSKARCSDFVCPPYMLSQEVDEGDVSWSLGEYVDPSTVWQAFLLPGKPRTPAGVFANQPSPYKARLGRLWGLCGGLAGVNVGLCMIAMGSAKQPPPSPGCCTTFSILALAAWPIATTVMSSQFEQRRWAESDHA